MLDRRIHPFIESYFYLYMIGCFWECQLGWREVIFGIHISLSKGARRKGRGEPVPPNFTQKQFSQVFPHGHAMCSL